MAGFGDEQKLQAMQAALMDMIQQNVNVHTTNYTTNMQAQLNQQTAQFKAQLEAAKAEGIRIGRAGQAALSGSSTGQPKPTDPSSFPDGQASPAPAPAVTTEEPIEQARKFQKAEVTVSDVAMDDGHY